MFDFGLMINSGARRNTGTGLGAFQETVDQAVWAEQHGFEAVWVGEGRLATNAVIPMTLIAAATERVKVGSGILPYRTRNAALLAVTFKTLDDLAPGRMRMGLGPWWEPLATRTGLPNHKPLRAMREVITVCKALLNGESVSFEGEFVNVDDIRFDGPNDDDGRSYPVPIYIGAVRMGMVKLSGEIADGVLLDFLVPPSYNLEAVAAAKEGAAKSGRNFDEFEVPQLVAMSTSDTDPDGAVDACRAFLCQYLAQQSHITEFAGADPELIAAIKAELGWPATTAQIRHTMRLVPDELVRSVTACGTATQTLDKIGEWVDAGCTEPVLLPLGDNQVESLESIVKAVNLTKSA
jgi:5,10-methylenetetrahydromethanopterin reductase